MAQNKPQRFSRNHAWQILFTLMYSYINSNKQTLSTCLLDGLMVAVSRSMLFKVCSMWIDYPKVPVILNYCNQLLADSLTIKISLCVCFSYTNIQSILFLVRLIRLDWPLRKVDILRMVSLRIDILCHYRPGSLQIPKRSAKFEIAAGGFRRK